MAASLPGLDLERLQPWFRDNVAPVAELTATIIGHGRSNLTYRIAADGYSWVLRRPPLSHVQATAHDMGREFRVISALHPTGFPVPRTYVLCDDTEVIGAQFYIMEYVDGFIAVDPIEVARRFDEADRRRIGEELVDVLVRLHSFVPAEIGLAHAVFSPIGTITRTVVPGGSSLPASSRVRLATLRGSLILRRLGAMTVTDMEAFNGALLAALGLTRA